MKKIYLTLLGAMMMSSVLAQSVEGYHLDSTYVENSFGQRTGKTVYEYNAAGKETVSYEYGYAGTQTGQLIGKTETTYNNSGVQTEEKTYEYINNSWELTSQTVYSEFNSAGLPTVAITKEKDDENPSAGLQPTTKLVYKAYYGTEPQDFEMYAWDGTEWMLSATAHIDFTSWGGVAKETMTMSFYGMSMTQTSTFEYDDHHMPIKMTSESSMMGNMEYTYTNTYDDKGLVTKVVETNSTSGSLTTFYFWSPNNSAGVNTVQHARQTVNGFYDMNGRHFDGSPKQKGIFIVNGQKVIVK